MRNFAGLVRVISGRQEGHGPKTPRRCRRWLTTDIADSVCGGSLISSCLRVSGGRCPVRSTTVLAEAALEAVHFGLVEIGVGSRGLGHLSVSTGSSPARGLVVTGRDFSKHGGRVAVRRRPKTPVGSSTRARRVYGRRLSSQLLVRQPL